MSSTATVDPVRAQVEASLRHLVEAVTAPPCKVVRRTRHAAAQAVDRVTSTVATSVGLARSLGELAFGTVFGQGRTAAPSRVRPPSALPERPVSLEASIVADPAESTDPVGSGADRLPLDDYESLATSHVVARLARLSADELVQVREFELVNRGRRTILGKIEQLLTHD